MEFYSLTNKGKTRSCNEDSYFSTDSNIGPLPNVFFVADGMGGENAGEYASNKATSIIIQSLRKTKEKKPIKAIKEAITYANTSLFNEAKEDDNKKGMGTTLVLTSIIDDEIIVSNVGDSRLYILSDGYLKQITIDHSFVGELLRLGKVTEKEAINHPDKNRITRAVGAEKDISIDFFDVDRKKGDIILLCSDGLTNMLSDEMIEEILNMDISLMERAEKLVDTSNLRGGIDNITVILIKI